MKNILTILIAITFNLGISQNPNFEGTWKWVNGNETLYVYIKSSTIPNTDNNNRYRMDYKNVNSSGVEIYSSKIYGQFYWAGSFLSQTNINIPAIIEGNIEDCTHPQTTDCLDGRIVITYIPPTGMNGQPKIRWEISVLRGGHMSGTSTNNPPSDFNLPIDIILTKVP